MKPVRTSASYMTERRSAPNWCSTALLKYLLDAKIIHTSRFIDLELRQSFALNQTHKNSLTSAQLQTYTPSQSNLGVFCTKSPPIPGFKRSDHTSNCPHCRALVDFFFTTGTSEIYWQRLRKTRQVKDRTESLMTASPSFKNPELKFHHQPQVELVLTART